MSPLACCSIALPKPDPQPSSPREHRLLRPRDPLARDMGGSFPTPPHIPTEPSVPATVLQPVMEQGVGPVCSVGSLYDPKPELLFLTNTLRPCGQCCLSSWHEGDLQQACKGSGFVTAFITYISLTRNLFLIYSKEKRLKPGQVPALPVLAHGEARSSAGPTASCPSSTCSAAMCCTSAGASNTQVSQGPAPPASWGAQGGS